MTMMTPVALVYYDNLLAGSQLVNRLQDLGYKVQALSEVSAVVSVSLTFKPLLFITHLPSDGGQVIAAIAALRAHPETAHIPVLGFTRETDPALADAARAAGATLTASEAGMLTQLRQLLDQALALDWRNRLHYRAPVSAALQSLCTRAASS